MAEIIITVTAQEADKLLRAYESGGNVIIQALATITSADKMFARIQHMEGVKEDD